MPDQSCETGGDNSDKFNPENLIRSTTTKLITALAFWLLAPCLAIAGPVNYDIVYLRAPRDGDAVRMKMPEVKDPIDLEAGTDLMLLHPDGSEEVLYDCDRADEDNGNEKCAIVDPVISFDARWVYFSKVTDQTDTNYQRRDAARSGADIYKMHLTSKQLTRLTFQEWTPNTGARPWSSNLLTSEPGRPNYLGYGIYNLGAFPLPDGRIVFTSSRNGYAPNNSFTFPNLQLFVMDDDGSNVELIGFLNLGSALHPVVLMDGRIIFSSFEAQGVRDSRVWGIWQINPDGTNWGPVISAFASPAAFHWQTQISDGSIVVVKYYNQNNQGFGTLYRVPALAPGGSPAFGSPNPSDTSNPAIHEGNFSNGLPQLERMPYSPAGVSTLTPFTHSRDNGSATGKVTQPSAAPNNDLLLVYSPGPANNLGNPIPYYDAGLYLLTGGDAAESPDDLVLIKNDPLWNEQQPRAVVSYYAIYGIAEPDSPAPLANDGSLHSALPAGTPFGLVGTSSNYRRGSTPGTGDTGFDGLDAFNSFSNSGSSNWGAQGSDAGKYSNSDIYAMRILAMEPTSAQTYGPNSGVSYRNHANERLRILGEIPLRKYDGSDEPILDSENNPDTSFLARIPADTPFTFQTIDRRGMVLNMAQTWHQLRPGEVRNNCGGCHSHSELALAFEGTEASKPGYEIPDLTLETPLLSINSSGDTEVVIQSSPSVDVEFHQDIKPIILQKCVQCHTGESAPAGLVLDDDTPIAGNDGIWHRLANDSQGAYGIPPLTQPYGWRQTNRSRYMRAFQSRRSLLIWKIYGERLDGWSNADHPTESVRGDKTTLPNGGSNSEVNLSDIDFDGSSCPPVGSSVTPLTEQEKITFARWIDLGAPISTPGSQSPGWFTDEQRPVLVLSQPLVEETIESLKTIRVGLFDYYSGLDMASLSVTADFELNGLPPGTELASGLNGVGDHVWELQIDQLEEKLTQGKLTISVKDNAGNLVSTSRSIKISAGEITELIVPIKLQNGSIEFLSF